jgi:hypothetical protein
LPELNGSGDIVVRSCLEISQTVRQSAILAVELRASDPMTPNSSAIEQFNTLTPAHQQQVVDFVAFLKSREQVKAGQAIAEVTTDASLQPASTNALRAFQSAGLVGCLDIDPTESYQSAIHNYLDQKYQQETL